MRLNLIFLLTSSRNKLINIFQPLQKHVRFTSSLKKNDLRVNKKKILDIKNNEVLKYLLDKPNFDLILKYFPSRFFHRKICLPDTVYLANEDIAKEIVNLIKNDLIQHDSEIIEVNPGVGFITKELLNIGLKKIHLFEYNEQFMDYLQEAIIKNNSSKIFLKKMDFFGITKIIYHDKLTNENKFHEYFSDIKHKSWEDDPAMKVFGVLPNRLFLKNLMFSIPFQTGLFSYGRTEFYLIMSPLLYQILVAKPKSGYFLYKDISILIQMTHDYQLISTFSVSDFLPWPKKVEIKNQTKFKEFKNSQESLVYFVKLTPKKDFYQQFEDPEMILHLFCFIRHHYRCKADRIIPSLEKWIPGCGTRLIHQNYSIFTQFGELNINEIVNLFKTFYNWPEYKNSPFLSLINSNYIKEESQENNDIFILEDMEGEVEEAEVEEFEELFEK